MYGDKKPFKRKFRPVKILFFILAAIGFVLLVGAIIMWLWNMILPDLLGTKEIKFWEAIGLLILSRLLFGGMRMGGSGHKERFRRKRDAWKQKWMSMSDEEKAEFKSRWRNRCEKK